MAALGDAVAHSGNTAGELCDTAGLEYRLLELGGEAFEGFVRGEHVVVGRHDRDVRLDHPPQGILVGLARGGEAVRQIGARETDARVHDHPLREPVANRWPAARCFVQ